MNPDLYETIKSLIDYFIERLKEVLEEYKKYDP